MNFRFWLVLVCACSFTHPTLAGQSTAKRGDPKWLLPVPELKADKEIPTLKKIVGHRWGEDISSHAEVERYLKALAKAAPDRTRLVKYGQSYQKKSLYYLIITSKANLKKIKTIRRDNLALADPRRTSAVRAKEIVGANPAVVWLAYCVHGNETSPSDAALLTAYHLLADSRKETKDLLEKLVVIIDPLQNPDGRDRFVTFHRQTRGAFDQPDPFASDRLEPWPGGRSNHYYFDMNRDWFRQSQKESKARVAAFLQWKPQIFVDAHEMGANSTFFFDPPKEPFNPHVLGRQKNWYMKIGKHHAKRFDQYGFPYTTREIFDAFGPQYGSTWPTLHGAIGILWEQAGARGRVINRNDKTKLYYHDGVRHHYISGLATVESAAKHRRDLLVDYYRNAADSVRSGKKGPIGDFFLLEGRRPARAAALARLLIRNGIEVRRVRQAAKRKVANLIDVKSVVRLIPKGSYHVSLAQPAARLALTLLERHQDMGKKFLERQEERVKRRKSDQIYDVTAWSLPLLFGVPCWTTSAPASISSDLISNPHPNGKVVGATAKVAYMMQGEDDAATAALSQWLRAGLRVHVMAEPTKTKGISFGRGSLMVRVAGNSATVHKSISQAAREYGLTIHALDSAFVEKGAGLGGPHARWVKPPRVLLMVDAPASYSAGHTWYLFDRVWRYPITRIAGRYLAKVNLEKFDVLILPHGAYKGDNAPTEDATRRIKSWVRGGGTLILIKGAANWATGKKVKILASEPVQRNIQPSSGAKEKTTKDKKADTEPPLSVPGAILRADVEPDHFVTYGVDKEVALQFTGNLLLKPLPIGKGKNLVRFSKSTNLLASGFCWKQTMKMLPGKSYVIYQRLGKGHIVGFADDPNFRAMSPRLQRLFFNAVFFGPGH